LTFFSILHILENEIFNGPFILFFFIYCWAVWGYVHKGSYDVSKYQT
jgi:hypothetical protein